MKVNEERIVYSCMKWRDFRFESMSSLHCTNKYGSPDYPMDRSSNRQCIGSTVNTNPNFLQRVQISPNGSKTLQHATQPINSHEHTPIYIHTPHIYMFTHAYTHVYTHIHTYTSTHIYANNTRIPIYIYTYIYTLTNHNTTHKYILQTHLMYINHTHMH